MRACCRKAQPLQNPAVSARVAAACQIEPSTLTLSGAAVLVSAIACGEAALDTSAQPHSGEAFTLREIDAMNIRGNALNAAAIALDTVGGRPGRRSAVACARLEAPPRSSG